MNRIFETEDHTPLAPATSWAERNGFSHWAVAMIWLVVGFFGFQLTAGIVLSVMLILNSDFTGDMDILELFSERVDLVFIGNSSGQILFLGLATWFVVRLHTSRAARPSFLRFSLPVNSGRMVGLTALLFVTVQPAIWYLGYLNSLLPVPETFSELQNTQYEMIENFLRTDGVIIPAMIHIALVPAICEEIMFRGYVQRAFEKSWGVWPAILISGLLFGMYHIQLANLLPLATLGILLALVTWLSGSLLPAIVAHFINNGGSVLLASYYPEMAFAELTAETAPPLWALLLSVIGSAAIIRLLFTYSQSNQDDHGILQRP